MPGFGAPVILGIRPEHLRWLPPGADGAIPARVELVERLEPECYVMAMPTADLRVLGPDDTAANAIHRLPLTLRCPADALPSPKADISVLPDATRAHLFDPVTGNVI